MIMKSVETLVDERTIESGAVRLFFSVVVVDKVVGVWVFVVVDGVVVLEVVVVVGFVVVVVVGFVVVVGVVVVVVVFSVEVVNSQNEMLQYSGSSVASLKHQGIG